MEKEVERKQSEKAFFTALLRKNRLGHAYLLEGPSGTGKKETARWVAASVLCLQKEETPCGQCANCRRIQTGQHPDVVEVEPDGQTIKVDQIRFLKSEFSKSGLESARKFFIIDQAEKMTPGAANSLLKFLEEPDGNVTAFLLTTAKNRLLPTILSRCQVIHFSQGNLRARIDKMTQSGIPKSRAALFAHLTNDLATAEEWNKEDWYPAALKGLWRWFELLEKKDLQAFVFVQTDLMALLKEKQQQLLFFDLLLLLYKELLNFVYSESTESAFPEQEAALRRMAERKNGLQTAAALEKILESRKKLESNVAMQGVLEQLSLQLIQE